MRLEAPQTVQDICRSKNKVGHLVKSAEAMLSFNSKLENWLDSELVSHCLISHIEEGIVYLVTDSSAWGTRLRFTTPHLLSKMRSDVQWSGIKSIKIRVCADTLTTLQSKDNLALPEAMSQNCQIPAEAREQLNCLLEQETDGALKTVLERILNKSSIIGHPKN